MKVSDAIRILRAHPGNGDALEILANHGKQGKTEAPAPEKPVRRKPSDTPSDGE